jgi:cyclase
MALSRRDFLLSSLAAPVLVRWPGRLGQGAPVAQTRSWAPVFTPVRRNVSVFTARGGTIAYLANADALFVVDSQYPDSATAFLEGLRARLGSRRIDVLINTHHHVDHTGGNPVFKPVTRTIVAQANVPGLQRQAAREQTPPVEQVYADVTFEDTWDKTVGDEIVHARKMTPAHTGGDAVVHFERANIVHVGDLVWGRLQAFVDRPGGASAVNWIKVTEAIIATYPADATYVWGHSGTGVPVVGTRTDVLTMRDYLTALIDYVRGEIKAGKSRDEIVASKDVLTAFPAFGPLTPRALAGTYDELAGG